MAPKSVPPLENNGTIKVYWGEPEQVIDYDLVSIHYNLDPSTGVAVCTLNEPQRLNALTLNQMWEFILILQHAKRDDAVKVLVWTGHGRAFSSGADLSGKAPPPGLKKEAMEWFAKTKGIHPGTSVPGYADPALKCVTLEFWDFPKPSICAVNGLAVGGAVNVALANYHDLVISSTEGRFQYPFANLGVTPELGSSRMIPMLVGMTRAKNMMMVGEWFSAQEAKDLGLLLEVTEPDKLMPRAMELATGLAKKSPDALRLSKQLMNSHLRKSLEEVMDEENRYMGLATESLRKAAAAKRAAAKL